MNSNTHFSRTPVTLAEIRNRVAFAFGRNLLCRGIQFEVISTPRLSAGANWTISMQPVAPDALWEASEIVSDIQDAYMLAEVRDSLSRAA